MLATISSKTWTQVQSSQQATEMVSKRSSGENVEEADNEKNAAAMAVAAAGHPDDFQVSGPRNLPMPTWRELISSSWKNDQYKRTVMACLIQAVYLLELDRQEQREGDAALAPAWWKPFKYRLAEVLVDRRDKSVFGAVFEWDTSAALSDFLVVRPRKAPKAVIAFRGTLLKSSTMRRDIHDDLRLLAMDDLSGSCRFRDAMEAVRLAAERQGSEKICMAGHSLGAGLALQVGRDLAEAGILVEAHLFNPPCVSLPMGLRSLGLKCEFLWKATKGAIAAAVTKRSRKHDSSNNAAADAAPQAPTLKEMEAKWVPHLYVNRSDYICCNYGAEPGPEAEETLKQATPKRKASASPKIHISCSGPTKFLEAHGIQQWWSTDSPKSELQMALHAGQLIHSHLSTAIRTVTKTH